MNPEGAFPFRPSELPAGPLDAQQARVSFGNYLSQLSDQESADICLGGRTFSARELAAEVQRGTDIGERMTTMYMRYINGQIAKRDQ